MKNDFHHIPTKFTALFVTILCDNFYMTIFFPPFFFFLISKLNLLRIVTSNSTKIKI